MSTSSSCASFGGAVAWLDEVRGADLVAERIRAAERPGREAVSWSTALSGDQMDL